MIRQQIIKIQLLLNNCRTKTIAAISNTLHISRDCIKRRLKIIKSRKHHPCSVSFETEAGQKWLYLLVILTIFYFGIKSNVGSNVLAEFLHMLGVGLYIGVSSGSLKRLEQKIDGIINNFGLNQDQLFTELAKNIDIHAAGDETYFENFNILVFMDLVSGFILKEEITTDRKSVTWNAVINNLLGKFRSFACLISDGSRVLKNLSSNTLKCIHFSDLFHMLNYFSSVMRFQFASKIKSIDKKLTNCQDEEEAKILSSAKTNLIDGQKKFKQQLHDVSAAVHPFTIKYSEAKNTQQVVVDLNESYKFLSDIKKICNLTDAKNKLTTFKNQIPFAAAQINEWWDWANISLMQFNVSNEICDWLLKYFLPTIYWQLQINKCRNKAMEQSYITALNIAKEKLSKHNLTKEITASEEYNQWVSWAKWITNHFQRTTSPVEGRNGVLSLASHFCRGITAVRLKSLTIIHNYHIRRNDHTTAAERLYKTKHDSLLMYILQEISGELPLPRAKKVRTLPEPLYLQCLTA